MKNILVPIDFGKPAVNALDFALDVALKSHGTVHMIHVIELPVMHDTLLMPTLNFEEELLKELREKAVKSFAKLIAKHNTENVKVKSEVLFGPVSAKIIECIEAKKIDLVVMGSHGSEGLREVLIGSNAEKIVRRSSAPVLVIKKYYKGPIKDIVFPVAFEIEDQSALTQKVQRLQTFYNARIHLVRINTPMNFASDIVTFKLLSQYAKQYGFKNFTTAVFNSQHAEHGIVEYANYIQGDLIAMGTHGRTGVGHVLLGSLTEDLVNHYKGLIWTYGYKNEPALVEQVL